MNQEINPYLQYMYSYPHKTAYRRLEGISLKDYGKALSKAENSLYFHIPFCETKCGYCNLFSVTGKTKEWMQRYVDKMEEHAEQVSAVLPEDAVFHDLTLGGGTPMILSPKQLEKIVDMAEHYFGFRREEGEIVIETSPNQTTPEKLALLKELCVNRVSIGVQSFHDRELKSLYRAHCADAARRALHDIRQTGFDCVNLDLIYGIPGQTMESLEASLNEAISFAPDEIFIYPLYVKPGTLLHRNGVKCSKEALEMQKMVREILKNAGYHPHSMRRFAKKEVSFSSCGFGNTISIGCGGRSYVGNLHFCEPYAVGQNACNAVLNDYMEKTEFLTVSHGVVLTEEEQKRRYVTKHILFGKGISKAEYELHFQQDVKEDFSLLTDWMRQGYAAEQGDFIALTEEGILLSDYLGPQLISEEVARRSAEFYQQMNYLG